MVAVSGFLFQATGILRNAESDLNTQICALFYTICVEIHMVCECVVKTLSSFRQAF